MGRTGSRADIKTADLVRYIFLIGQTVPETAEHFGCSVDLVKSRLRSVGLGGCTLRQVAKAAESGTLPADVQQVVDVLLNMSLFKYNMFTKEAIARFSELSRKDISESKKFVIYGSKIQLDGDEIRRRRIEAGLTRSELAKRAGLNGEEYEDIEDEISRVDVAKLCLIGDVLGVSWDKLVRNE